MFFIFKINIIIIIIIITIGFPSALIAPCKKANDDDGDDYNYEDDDNQW